jgi:opacity protein-like surface antigen
MKVHVSLMALAILFTATTTLQAQNGDAKTYETKGFYLNASLLGASWTVDNLSFDDEYGGGAGLKLGYNFNKNLGLFTSLNAALMSPDEDEYVLAHLDIGLQGTLGSATSRVRPFLNVAASGMTAQDDETEINGAGLSVGGGVLLFLSESMALDISYTHGLIELSEFKMGSQTVDLDESATTMRLLIGLGFYF